VEEQPSGIGKGALETQRFDHSHPWGKGKRRGPGGEKTECMSGQKRHFQGGHVSKNWIYLFVGGKIGVLPASKVLRKDQHNRKKKKKGAFRLGPVSSLLHSEEGDPRDRGRAPKVQKKVEEIKGEEGRGVAEESKVKTSIFFYRDKEKKKNQFDGEEGAMQKKKALLLHGHESRMSIVKKTKKRGVFSTLLEKGDN